MLNGETVLAINSETDSVEKFKVGQSSEADELCDQTCTSVIKNPLNLAVDINGSNVYVLDSTPHPTLPTYSFSIKEISLAGSTEATTKPATQGDFSQMLKFYSRWFATRNSAKH